MSQEKAASVYFQVAMERLQQQRQLIDGIDSKLATTFATSSIVMSIFAGFLGDNTNNLPWNAIVLLGAGLVVYVALALFAYLGYKPRDWSFRPKLETLGKNSNSYGEEAMKIWVADECTQSYEQNKDDSQSKAEHLKRVMRLLVLQMLLLTGAAIAAVV